MDSLSRAAVIWDSLSDTEYRIVIGRRGKTRTLHIRFRAADFFHLSGMHYASDVDFKLHKKQFDGARLIGALLSGKLDGSLIGKSRNYQEKIAGRLRCLCHLPDFFEGDFELYEYRADHLPFHSKIEAQYLLYHAPSGIGCFLFLDREDDICFCRSVFEERDSGDYRRNQTRWTILQTAKTVQNHSIILYQKPGYPELQPRKEPIIMNTTYTGSVLIHPDELDNTWIDRCAALGIPRLGLHPVGGQHAHESMADLLAKLETPEYRALLDRAAELGIEIEYEMHAGRYLMPLSAFAEHPEWQRMNEAGERVSDLNFCVTNDDALNFYAKNAAVAAKKLYRSTNRFFFWMDDAKGGGCHCENCRKLSPSDQQLHVANRVLAEIKKEIPDATFAYLGYVDCLVPPTTVKPADGIFLEYAPIERDFHKPIYSQDAEKNRIQNEHLAALLKLFGTETAKVLDYWLDNSLYSGWTKPPKPFTEDKDVVKADIAYYKDLGFTDMSTFACYLGPDYIELHGDPDITGFAAELRALMA